MSYVKRMTFITKFFSAGAPKVEPTVTRDALLEAMQYSTWCAASGDRAANKLIQTTKTNLSSQENPITKDVARGAILEALSHVYRNEKRLLGEDAGDPTEKQKSQIATHICGQSFELAQRLQAKSGPVACHTANLNP